MLRTSGIASSRSHVEVDLVLLRSATGLRSEDFDLDRPVSLGDLARAWPIDARTVGIRRPILFVGFTVPESSEFVTVLALPPNPRKSRRRGSSLAVRKLFLMSLKSTPIGRSDAFHEESNRGSVRAARFGLRLGKNRHPPRLWRSRAGTRSGFRLDRIVGCRHGPNPDPRDHRRDPPKPIPAPRRPAALSSMFTPLSG